MIICLQVKKFNFYKWIHIETENPKQTWIIFFPSSYHMAVFNAKTLLMLTGLPTTDSSVSEGRASSFSSSAMSCKKKRNKNILSIFSFSNPSFDIYLPLVIACCVVIIETYASGLNNFGVGRMEAADERDYICELSLISREILGTQ